MKPPVVIFGAFDRHNFGDLLFAHIAGAMLRPRRLRLAGLAAADLRPAGGHRVSALPDVLAQGRGRRIDLVHAGGELLTCSAWQAAVMLLPPGPVPALVARLDADIDARTAWAQARNRVADLAPYVASPASLHRASRVIHAGVGGMDLDHCGDAMRKEVLDKLRRADAVAVRDRLTQAALANAGIPSRLMPDPASLTAALFGRRIRRHAQAGAVAAARLAFPGGYLAVQFSADFGDDATLDAIAAGLDRAARQQRCGVVFFRAGAAPWHDDLDSYRRTAARMHAPARILHSLNLWDICALLAGARGYIGSSLHGRIVAMAYALPRLNLRLPADTGGHSKQAAYADAWDSGDMPGVVSVADMADALARAMHTDAQDRRDLADRLLARCRAEYGLLAQALRGSPYKS